jgi:uncharacterized metal-binding protein
LLEQSPVVIKLLTRLVEVSSVCSKSCLFQGNYRGTS